MLLASVWPTKSTNAAPARRAPGDDTGSASAPRDLRDESLVGHRTQDDVAAILRALGRREGRPGVGRLDHAGDRGGLAQRQVADVLAEEQPRRLGDPVHRKRSALAEIDLVQVHLEDLVLRRLALENDRHVLLGELALERLLGREEEVLDELLRERAAADEVLPVAAQVRDDRADRTDDVHARWSERRSSMASTACTRRDCRAAPAGVFGAMSAVSSGGSASRDRSASRRWRPCARHRSRRPVVPPRWLRRLELRGRWRPCDRRRAASGRWRRDRW